MALNSLFHQEVSILFLLGEHVLSSSLFLIFFRRLASSMVLIYHVVRDIRPNRNENKNYESKSATEYNE